METIVYLCYFKSLVLYTQVVFSYIYIYILIYKFYKNIIFNIINYNIRELY